MDAVTAVSVICLLAVLSVSGETYPEEFDKLDLDALLSDIDKMNHFSACLQDNATCSERATTIKG
jgi:hypothetical protein